MTFSHARAHDPAYRFPGRASASGLSGRSSARARLACSSSGTARSAGCTREEISAASTSHAASVRCRLLPSAWRAISSRAAQLESVRNRASRDAHSRAASPGRSAQPRGFLAASSPPRSNGRRQAHESSADRCSWNSRTSRIQAGAAASSTLGLLSRGRANRIEGASRGLERQPRAVVRGPSRDGAALLDFAAREPSARRRQRVAVALPRVPLLDRRGSSVPTTRRSRASPTNSVASLGGGASTRSREGSWRLRRRDRARARAARPRRLVERERRDPLADADRFLRTASRVLFAIDRAVDFHSARRRAASSSR